MKPAQRPDNEYARQKSLESMGILTSKADPELDRITRVAQRIFGSEIVAISLLDNDRQFSNPTSINRQPKPRVTFHFAAM